jgi:acetolactate synthase regulatory subunit
MKSKRVEVGLRAIQYKRCKLLQELRVVRMTRRRAHSNLNIKVGRFSDNREENISLVIATGVERSADSSL